MALEEEERLILKRSLEYVRSKFGLKPSNAKEFNKHKWSGKKVSHKIITKSEQNSTSVGLFKLPLSLACTN